MKRVTLLVISLFLMGATNAYADLKIGVVNLDEVVQKAPIAQAYNEKLSLTFKPKQDSLNALQKSLQDDLDKLNYLSYKLTPTERNELQVKINNEKRDYEALSGSLQKEFSTTQAQYTQAIMSKLNSVIAKIAQDGKYDIIQPSTNLLYVDKTIDITAQVVQEMR